MNGALLVDKPTGPTSHDVVARARRSLNERSIGHTGTLDPLATGLLVLLCGRATRLASLMSGAVKTYEALVRLGTETDTYDVTGTPRVIEGGVSPAAIDDAAVDEVIEAIRQQRAQRPPPFSAKKVGGIRAYKLARRNETPELKPVDVCVYALDWRREAEDILQITLTCSAGYYVRAMAQEIGARLGCGAHLASLRRTRVGGLAVEDALPLERVEREPEAAAAGLLPMESLLASLPAVRLNDQGDRRARHGNVLRLMDVAKWDDAVSAVQPAGEAVRYRVFGADGALIAIATATPAGLQPSIVLADPA